MAKREADFSQKTKMTIAYRCGHKCSNPTCGHATMVEDSKGELYSIGRACHIEAASEGGPRYNPDSSPEERKAVTNAIWLCPVCADIIDKDKDKYPTKLLKEWKMAAEKPASDKNRRIIAVANQSGGVGTSSVTAYLAQAVAMMTEEKVLCISAAANNDSGIILFGATDEIEKSYIIPTKHPCIDYMSDAAISKLYREDVEIWGRTKLNRLMEEKKYKYIFVDCGNGTAGEKFALFHMATDVIIPIGEHSQTNIGIKTVGRWIQKRFDNVRVWPLYSIGLTFSNKIYKRKWYQRVWGEINKIAENEKVSIRIPSVVIPKSYYVCGNLDIWSNQKTKHVAEAYMDFASELLK